MKLCCDLIDLQHPPEYVPTMLAALSPTHTFVLGTRYGKGVEMDKDWPVHRRIISAGARVLALPLTTASDPMSGFFGVRKEAVSTDTGSLVMFGMLTHRVSVLEGQKSQFTRFQDCTRLANQVTYTTTRHRRSAVLFRCSC